MPGASLLQPHAGHPRTCAEAADEAAIFLAAYDAVCRVRAPSDHEQQAALKARYVLQGAGIPIPAGLQ